MNRFLRSTDGQQIAEFAVIVPLLVTLMLGIFEFGRAYQVYSALSSAAIAGAKAASLPTCATCGNQYLTPNQIAAQAVAPILETNHIQLAAISPGTCGNPGDVVTSVPPTICVNQGTAPMGPNTVRFVYPYSFGLPLGSYSMRISGAAESLTN